MASGFCVPKSGALFLKKFCRPGLSSCRRRDSQQQPPKKRTVRVGHQALVGLCQKVEIGVGRSWIALFHGGGCFCCMSDGVCGDVSAAVGACPKPPSFHGTKVRAAAGRMGKEASKRVKKDWPGTRWGARLGAAQLFFQKKRPAQKIFF